MRGILADNDVGGYLRIIHTIWLSDEWHEIWTDLALSVETFATLQIAADSSDDVVWRTCQREKLVLVTGNRNADRPDSLQIVVASENRPHSLPVVTLANPQRITRDRLYAESAAVSLLERLFDIENFRGAGRIDVP